MSYQYENIYIGNFIYTFGFFAGRETGKSNQASFSILQQTPKDTTLGDLFANWQGRNFLIEFKREAKLINTELKKESRVRLLNILKDSNNRQLKDLSRKGHFICYPSKSSLELLSYCSIADIPEAEKIPFSSFAQAILSNGGTVGMNYTEFSVYCDLLAALAAKESSGSTSSMVSGLIVNLNQDNEIRFVEYKDLNFLSQKIESALDRSNKQEQERSRGRESGLSM